MGLIIFGKRGQLTELAFTISGKIKWLLPLTCYYLFIPPSLVTLQDDPGQQLAVVLRGDLFKNCVGTDQPRISP